MAVAIQSTPTFSAGNVMPLFEAASMLLDGRRIGTMTGRTYDVSRDGQRFLMIREEASGTQSESPGIVVVQNWFEELKNKVAAGK
jgi:hypothetical protein